MKSLLSFVAGAMLSTTLLVLALYTHVLHNSFFDEISGRNKARIYEQATAPSPDGAYSSVKTKVGNRDGWCEYRVTVQKNGEEVDWEHGTVFFADCDIAVDQKWVDDTHLTISYASPDPTRAVSTSQEFFSNDRAIQISYHYDQ